MALGKAAIIKLILNKIGGLPLMPIPTTTILGGVTTTQIGAGALVSLAGAAKQVAGAVGSLSEIAKNPLGDVIGQVNDNVKDLVSNNFSNLDSTLSSVASDSNLTDNYSKLKDALGGGDGQSGIYAQLNKFKEHTDRVSGVKLNSESVLNNSLTVPENPGGRNA